MRLPTGLTIGYTAGPIGVADRARVLRAIIIAWFIRFLVFS
jgi:hypothetical protein